MCSLDTILLDFSLFHFVLQDQTCLLLQVSQPLISRAHFSQRKFCFLNMVRRDQEAQTVSSNICIPGRGDYRDGSQRVGHHCMSLSISHEEGHAWHSCWYISYFFLDCCLCSRLACDLIWEKTYLYFHLSSFWLQILGESYPAPITHDLLVLWRSNSWAVHILREKVFYWEWILDWLWQTRMNVSWKSQLLRILFYSPLSRQRNKSYTHIPPHTTTAGSFLFFFFHLFLLVGG